jgi:hypothetical protein
MTIHNRDTDLDTSEHPHCAHAEHCDLLADGLRDGVPISSTCAIQQDGYRLTPAEVFALARRIHTYGV